VAGGLWLNLGLEVSMDPCTAPKLLWAPARGRCCCDSRRQAIARTRAPTLFKVRRAFDKLVIARACHRRALRGQSSMRKATGTRAQAREATPSIVCG